MRSILLQNIKNVQQANVKTWSLANKNPLNFIGCYACLGYKHVYLQRGFRNYGIPQVPALLKIGWCPQKYEYSFVGFRLYNPYWTSMFLLLLSLRRKKVAFSGKLWAWLPYSCGSQHLSIFGQPWSILRMWLSMWVL